MFARHLATLGIIASLVSSSTAQLNVASTTLTTTQTANLPSGFVLQDSTPVKLRINRTISSADVHTGDQVDFEVLEEVRLNGELVIAKGGTAIGTVTEAQAKRRMARGGKLDMTIDYVRLLDSEKAALRAVKDVSGGGHTGGMVAGIVVTSLVVWPAAPFFLLMHGKDITIPKDTEITAYINGNMPLDIAKFQPKQNLSTPIVAAAPLSPSAVEQMAAELDLSSTPSGADIEIDGNFVGSTPSTVGVAAGSHRLMIKKNGFQLWEKTLAISSGKITIATELKADAQESQK